MTTASSPSWETTPQRPGRALLRAVALVLFCAAALKVIQFRHDSPASPSLLFKAAVEAAFGGWLATGLSARWATRATLGIFIAFAVTTLIETYYRQNTCGCFGALNVPPASTFMLDLTIVALLFSSQPTQPFSRYPFSRRALVGLSIFIVGLLLLAFVRRPRAGFTPVPVPLSETISTRPSSSTPDIAASSTAPIRRISPTEWLATLGAQPSGTIRSVVFPLDSPTGQELHIRGVNASCGCTSLPDPPVSIPAKGLVSTHVVLHFPSTAGDFDSSIMITTDAPMLAPLTLHIKAELQ